MKNDNTTVLKYFLKMDPHIDIKIYCTASPKLIPYMIDGKEVNPIFRNVPAFGAIWSNTANAMLLRISNNDYRKCCKKFAEKNFL